jgi:glycosyltransferase involved in cell wall biosynthesis
MTGRILVMDSYEPHATAMVEAGVWKKSSLSFKILFWLEKRLSKKAAHVIATTKGMKTYAKEKYGVELRSFFVKPACIDFDHFYPRPKDEKLLKDLNLTGKLVCVYAGKLGGTYLDDEVFDFIKSCYDFWGDNFRFLMLTSETNEKIAAQIQRIRIPANVVIKRFIAHSEIPRYLSLGDFAINPQVPVPSKRFGSPIKNGEYWAMGLPVVISPGISDDSDIIAEKKIGVVVDFKEKTKLPAAVEKIDGLMRINNNSELRRKIREVAIIKRGFSIAEKIYKTLYNQ